MTFTQNLVIQSKETQLTAVSPFDDFVCSNGNFQVQFLLFKTVNPLKLRGLIFYMLYNIFYFTVQHRTKRIDCLCADSAPFFHSI